MSTNFLNRRMDLLHSVATNTNFLTMDTSYPVKIAGKILKLFTAANIFNTNDWKLQNSESEVILTINSDHVYDFAGRVIKNNIGEEKAYATNADVYKLDDYVMVIIDFDGEHNNANPSIHLCSQTNFENFITSGVEGDGNIRLFNITGDTEVDGFEYPINVDKFEEAELFDNDEDEKYSLLRSDVDGVIYEKPIISDDSDAVKSMTPVSNINNININTLNTSVQNFIYPFFNNRSDNKKRGEDTVDGLMSYVVTNGEVNDEFINKFCFTYEEVQQLPIWGIKYTKSEANLLSNPEDYYYVLSANCNNNNYSSEVCDDTVIFIPIKKSSKTFATYRILSNNGFKVNGTNVSIPATKIFSGFGTWFSEDVNDGFMYWQVEGILHCIDIYERVGVGYRRIINNGMNPPYYKLYNDRTNSAGIKVSYSTPSISVLYSAENMQTAKRFIEFFGNDDSSYVEHIKTHVLNIPSSVYNGRISYKQGDSFITQETPQCVITEYPELFEHVLFDKSGSSYSHNSENIHNFNSLYNGDSDTNFDRTKYTSNSRIDICNNYRNEQLMYQLFDCGMTEGLCSTKIGTVLNDKFNNISSDYKFKANRTLSGKSISHYTATSNYFPSDIIMVTPISKVSVATIKPPYYTDTKPNYNNAELKHQNFITYKRVKYANEYISIDESTGDLIYHPGGLDSSVEYELYIITKKASGESPQTTHAIYGDLIIKKANINDANDNFKNMDTVNNNIVYLYYIDASYNVGRIKYYYDGTETGRTISNFDYISINTIISSSQSQVTVQNLINGKNLYDLAYVNYLASVNNENVQSAINRYNNEGLTWLQRVVKITSLYSFYPLSLNNRDLGVNYEAAAGLPRTRITSTATLTIGMDEKIKYAIWPNTMDDKINNGCGWKLKDMPEIGDNYALYQNGQCPYLSNEINPVTGGKIYNIYNYNKYIKNMYVNGLFLTEEMKYLNGSGIRPEYYNGVTLYDFYKYALSHDLGKPRDDEKSLYTKIDTTNKAMFTRDMVNSIKGYVIDTQNNYIFKDSNNDNITLETANNNGITLHQNINSQNVFGFNESTLENSNDNNVTENYITNEPIYLIKTQSGKKISYAIALTEGDIFTPSIPSINGNIADISVDKLKWSSLLNALNNNKTINILSDSIINIKTSVNSDFMDTTQNINDEVTMADNDSIEARALASEEKFDPSSSHYCSVNGEFDEEHNISKFNYGYGFVNNERRINERGVIVLVSKDGFVSEDTNGQSDPENFSYRATLPTIYPKRMYINNDGLLCTKEFYDKEKSEYTPSGSTGPVYPSNTTTIAALLKKIEELENRIAALES